MTRRAVTNPVDLGHTILSYRDVKQTETAVKKQVAELGSVIKEEMNRRNLPEFVVDDVCASITVTPKEEVNDLHAIEILRTQLTPEQFSKVVKTKEYIDEDEFERMVYAHEVDASILSPAITHKEPTITLRLKKVKN